MSPVAFDGVTVGPGQSSATAAGGAGTSKYFGEPDGSLLESIVYAAGA